MGNERHRVPFLHSLILPFRLSFDPDGRNHYATSIRSAVTRSLSMKVRIFAALAVAVVLAAGCGPATHYKYRIAVIPKG